MLIKYWRLILLAVMLCMMSFPSAFATGKDRRHKICVDTCKARHNRAKDACHNMRGHDRKQCKRLADDAYHTCKDLCPR